MLDALITMLVVLLEVMFFVGWAGSLLVVILAAISEAQGAAREEDSV